MNSVGCWKNFGCRFSRRTENAVPGVLQASRQTLERDAVVNLNKAKSVDTKDTKDTKEKRQSF